MKQLRPVITRIVKKIPDEQIEGLLSYLVATYPEQASPEQTQALTASIKREVFLEKRGAELEAKLLEYTKDVDGVPPPNGGTTTEENTIQM
jgi:hypothetical protein